MSAVLSRSEVAEAQPGLEARAMLMKGSRQHMETGSAVKTRRPAGPSLAPGQALACSLTRREDRGGDRPLVSGGAGDATGPAQACARQPAQGLVGCPCGLSARAIPLRWARAEPAEPGSGRLAASGCPPHASSAENIQRCKHDDLIKVLVLGDTCAGDGSPASRGNSDPRA